MWAWGLDLWFNEWGFQTIWWNEYDKTIWDTIEYNFPGVELDKRSITDIKWNEVPNSIWIIWWPPCQSWSEAWAWRGINDKRWKLFYDYIRILKEKKPLFFLAENVSGILADRHRDAFNGIIKEFSSLWYNVTYNLLNANDYWVPQDRNRVIIVWYNKIMGKYFIPPEQQKYKPTLKDAIFDLRDAKPALERNYANEEKNLSYPNNEYMTWAFSSIYMSRNRVRSWNEPSFTIQAWWRHAPIHPQAPKMKFVWVNKRIFEPWKEYLYRRLSVRECARIQTFPDSFIFKYKNIADWYKMVWNAVAVNFAKCLAEQIYSDIDIFLKGHLEKTVLNTNSLYKITEPNHNISVINY